MAEGAKRGRPAYRATAEKRERVEILVATGMAEEEIARVIGIAPNTLRKHFREELLNGRAKRRGAVIEAMFRAATGGNVSAQKAYVQLTDLAPPAARTAEKAAKPGKKEIAERLAETAAEDTGWNGLVH